jgi:hypothetical protein
LILETDDYEATAIDLVGLIAWLKKNRPELL